MKLFFKKFSLDKAGLLLWCLLAMIFLYGNWLKFWTDSEMWAIVATKYYFSGQNEYFFNIKPLFHFLLWLNFQWSAWLEIFPVDLARFEAGFTAILVMVFCDLYLQQKKVGDLSRFLFQMTLFSCSTWLYRAGEVRSDICSCLVLIFCLWRMSREGKTPRKLFWGLTAFAVSFLLTPKSGLVFLVLTPFFVNELPENSFRTLMKYRWRILFGALLFLLILHQMILSSFEFFLNEFSVQEAGLPFFSLIRFEHIFKMFLRNPQLIFMTYGVFFGAFTQKRFLFKSSLFWSPFLVILFIICYPDPLPFFLAALLPWMLLGFFLSLDQWLSPFRGMRKRLIQLGAALLCVGSFSWWEHRLLDHNSMAQRTFANWANDALLIPGILIYDPSGIILHSNAQHWFLGPAMGKQYEETMQKVAWAQPEVVLYTFKALFLEPELSQWLKENYYPWGPSVFIRRKISRDLREKNCDTIASELSAFFFKVRKRDVVYLWDLRGTDRKTHAFSLQDPKLCEEIKSPKEYLVFSMDPPPAPAEQLRDIFRYDPEF
jgi:hypothetical protein